MSNKYYQKHKAELIAKSMQRYYNNKEYILAQRKQRRQLLTREEKDKHNLYKREQYKNKVKNNLNYLLSKRLRTRLYLSIKQHWKSGSAIKDLGCSIEKFKLWIEMQWKDGMSWDNYGEWHLDHKIPLSKFNLANRDEFLQAVNFANIQPLWAEENLKKGNN